MRRDEDRRRRLPWLAAIALVVGPLVLTPPAHAAASPVADQGIQDTGAFASYDVMANDGTDGSQTITLPGNADADVTTDGFEISVDLSAHAVPFVGTKVITYQLEDADLNPIGQATLTVKVVDPSAVQITAGNGQATVSWPGLPSGVTGMRITSSTSPVFDHSAGTTVTSAGTGDKVVTGLTNGTTYHFFITATYGGQDDPGGATGVATPRAAANHAPVAVPDTVSLVGTNPKSFFPTDNDTDADGDILVMTGHSAPAHGSVTCGSGFCEYTPAGSPVSDTFTYTVADGYGGTATGTVSLVARNVTATSDSAATFVDESTRVDVLSNDSGVLAGDQADLGAVPAGVDAFVDGDGSVVVSGVTQGSYQIPYTVIDSDGDTLASSHISATIGAKRPLVAYHDDATTDLDLATDISVGQNDTFQVPGAFPLSNSGTKITVNPAHGTATLGFAPQFYFGHNFDLDGSLQNLPVIHYVPSAHFTGDDSLTYQIQDAQNRTDTATVAIHVGVPQAKSFNAVPKIGQADLTWTLSQSPAVDDVRLCYTQGNDRTTSPAPAASATTCAHEVTLPAGVPTSTTMSALTNDVWYTASVFVHSNDGTANGVWSSGASTSFRPGVDPVSHLDGDGGPTSFQVTWTNPDAPRASTGTTVRYSTSAYPTSPVDGAGGTSVGPGVTQASVPGLTAGTYFVSVFSTNTATYGDPRHITLTLAANNHAPVALADVADLNENTFANVAVLGNDTDADAGDLHDVRSYTQPTHGTVFCAGDAATAQAWSCHYVPTHNYVGDDSFTYLVTDHRFGTATGTVTLHVHQVNTAPQAADDSVTATLGHATPINLTVDTFDAEGNTLTYAVVTPPAHTSSFSCTTAGACTYTGNALGSDSFTWHATDNGTNPNNLVSRTATMSITVVANQPPLVQDRNASVNAGAAVQVNVATGASDPDGDPLTFTVFSQPQKGTVSCTTAGACTYTAGAAATGQDSFNFQADDGHGGKTIGSVLITITHVNHAPVTTNGTFGTDNATGRVVDLSLLTTDQDNDPLTYSKVSGPTPSNAGTVVCSDTSCTYTPSSGFTGAVTFTYKANDSHVDSNTSTVTINVTQANRPPVAVGDSAQAKPAQQISVDVAANDSDPDGDALSYAVNGQPVHGTASCTTVGTCSYQSVGGYSGGDSFTYTVSDGHGHTVGATVAITVAANASPIATNDSVSTTTNHEVTVAVGANDSDPNSDPLTFAKATDPSHGTATCTSAGSCTYTPATDYVGSDSFTYTVSDGFGGQAVGTVSVTVKAPGSVSAGRGGPAARSVTSPLKVTGSAAPVQPGSTVALQRLNGSTWVTVASTAESATGGYAFSLKQPTGTFSYRVFVAGSTTITDATSATLTAAFYQAAMPASSTSGDEYVIVKNTGKVTVNLRGWTVKTKAGKVLTLPSFSLKPGKSVKVHTKKGSGNATNIYLNKPNSFAAHDTLTLRDPAKIVVATRKF